MGFQMTEVLYCPTQLQEAAPEAALPAAKTLTGATSQAPLISLLLMRNPLHDMAGCEARRPEWAEAGAPVSSIVCAGAGILKSSILREGLACATATIIAPAGRCWRYWNQGQARK